MRKFGIRRFFILLISICCMCNHAAAFSRHLVTIKIVGIKGEALKNVQHRLNVLAKTYPQPFLIHTFSDYKKQVPSNVLKALQPYGYYKPRILVYDTRGTSAMKIYIIPGPKMRVTDIKIKIEGSGKNQEYFNKYLHEFPLKTGTVLDIRKYLRAKKRFFTIAQQHGYIKARLKFSEVAINLKNYTAKISLYFDTNEQYYFGPVTFSKTNFSATFLNRYIQFNSRVPFSSLELIKLQDALSGSDYFQNIVIKPQYDKDQHKLIPINIHLAPRPAQTYTVGLGYGTDTGVRGTLGWNLQEITPTGHKFQTVLQGSPVQNTLQGRYLIPGFNPITDQYSLAATAYNLNYPNSRSDAGKVTATYTTDKKVWQRNMSINGLYEHYYINNSPDQNRFVLYPNFNWKFMHSDNPIFSKNGYSVNYNLQGSSTILLSDVSFLQQEINVKYAKTLIINNVSMNIIPHQKILVHTDHSISYLPSISDSLRNDPDWNTAGKQQPSYSPAESLKSPLKVILKNVQINQINVITDKKYQFDQLEASLSGNQSLVHINQFNLHDYQHILALNGKIDFLNPKNTYLSAKIIPLLKNSQHLIAHVVLSYNKNYYRVRGEIQHPFKMILDGAIHQPFLNPKFTIFAEWEKFLWPLKYEAKYKMDQGQFTLQGTLNNYQATLNTALKIGHYEAPIAIEIWGHGSLKNIKVNHIKLTNRITDLTGNATVSWRPKLLALINLKSNNLNFIDKLSSQFHNSQGSFAMQMQASGTIQQPIISASGSLLHGSTELPELGIKLKNISLQANIIKNELDFKGGFTSDDGDLVFNGHSLLKNSELLTNSEIHGKDLTIINNKEYRLLISPQLKISSQNDTIQVTGNVIIPQANIRPDDFLETVNLPSDVVFVDSKPTAKLPWAITSNIQVMFGDDVNISVHGLKGKLKGTVALQDQPSQATKARGELTLINGSYHSYGQDLKVSKGTLSFLGGPIDNPLINLETSRTFTVTNSYSPISKTAIPISTATITTSQPVSQFDKMTIGIRVSGHLEDPNIKLYSNPATLSQADILSYLVLARPAAQASQADKKTLVNALTLLNVGGNDTNQIIQEFNRVLGIDISVEDNTLYDPTTNSITNMTSMVINKKLSSKLFINYSMGLIQNINILKIKYLINPHWSLQTTSSTIANGIDILYNFSRTK